jgi:hypothetical protein
MVLHQRILPALPGAFDPVSWIETSNLPVCFGESGKELNSRHKRSLWVVRAAYSALHWGGIGETAGSLSRWELCVNSLPFICRGNALLNQVDITLSCHALKFFTGCD